MYASWSEPFWSCETGAVGTGAVVLGVRGPSPGTRRLVRGRPTPLRECRAWDRCNGDDPVGSRPLRHRKLRRRSVRNAGESTRGLGGVKPGPEPRRPAERLFFSSRGRQNSPSTAHLEGAHPVIGTRMRGSFQRPRSAHLSQTLANLHAVISIEECHQVVYLQTLNYVVFRLGITYPHC